jgi:Divergent InlB B-repeat domain
MKNRTSKLLLVAMMVATATVSALRAGSAFQSEHATTASSDPTKFSLNVKNGNHSGNYTAGTLVTVSANEPKPGEQFAGWTGDVQVLANPGASTTTAMVPFTAVSITATYSSLSAANAQPSADR